MFIPDASSHRASLERASGDYMSQARREQTPNSAVDATSLAFQAGYFALLFAVNAEMQAQPGDHPNAEIACEGARRLSLCRADQNLADLGARNYYEPTSLKFLASQQEWIDWAERVRTAAGMSSGLR